MNEIQRRIYTELDHEFNLKYGENLSELFTLSPLGRVFIEFITKKLERYDTYLDSSGFQQKVDFGETIFRDEEGFRVYDAYIDTVAEARGEYGKHMIMPYIPMMKTSSYTDIDSCFPTEVQPTEEYDKILTLKIAIDDDHMRKIKFPHNEDNVALKAVKDCNVSELLYATNKKLKKRAKK